MQQILNGILTTLSAAITDPAQTAGIQVAAIPAGFNNTSGVPVTAGLFNANGSLEEAITFTGFTGAGPFTLTGVARSIEGSGATYPSGTSIAIGVATAGMLASAFITTSNGGLILASSASGSGQSPLVITSSPNYFNGSSWSLVPHAGSLHISADQSFPAIYIDSFDSTGINSYRSIINLRSASGTANSPTGTLAGQEIGRISARGFSSTGTVGTAQSSNAFTPSLASVSFVAAENTTNTSQGCAIVFRTTPIGTIGGSITTLPAGFSSFHPSGGFSLYPANAQPADPGNGCANFAGSLTLGTNLAFSAGGTFSLSGAFATTLVATGATTLTLPTSGTLATTAQIPSVPVTAVTSANGLTLSAGTLAFSGANYSPLAGSASIITLGTISTGTWTGTVIAGQYGGTGIANTGKTLTLGGNLTTSGAFATTLTTTAATNITLPTSGTLLTSTSNLAAANLVGTATNDNAAAGNLGEYVTAVIAAGAAVTITTSATPVNVTSISLTAGDWDLTGVVDTSQTGASTALNIQGGISSTSATLGAQDSFFSCVGNFATQTTDVSVVPTLRFSLATTTTIFLVAAWTGSTTGTMKAFGTIRARRMR